MKEPKFIIFNDVHIKQGNEEDCERSLRHLLKYCTENNILDLVFAGDMFDNRTSQRLSVLKVFTEFLNSCAELNINVYAIPGNHDKTRYDSIDNFLDVFGSYDNFMLFRDISNCEIGGINVTFLPYFTDKMLVERVKEHNGSDMLIGHFAINGSSHLGHVVEDSALNASDFKKWDKVYLGHYHNYHKINKDIFHLPSIRQNNFGEDNDKGFTVIYNNLTHAIIPGDFTEYVNFYFDADNGSQKELENHVNSFVDSDKRIKFTIVGDQSKVKSIDKSIFRDTNIMVSLNYNEDSLNTKATEIIKKHTEKSILENFACYCEEKGLDKEEGLEMIENFLNS